MVVRWPNSAPNPSNQARPLRIFSTSTACMGRRSSTTINDYEPDRRLGFFFGAGNATRFDRYEGGQVVTTPNSYRGNQLAGSCADAITTWCAMRVKRSRSTNTTRTATCSSTGALSTRNTALRVASTCASTHGSACAGFLIHKSSYVAHFVLRKQNRSAIMN